VSTCAQTTLVQRTRLNPMNSGGFMRIEHGAGTLILRDGILLPKSAAIQSVAYCDGWRKIKGMSTALLDRTLRSAGWNRFYIAGELRTLELGNGREDCIRRGISRLAARARASNFNCLEVTGMTQKWSFGIPFVYFCATACHIQQGSELRVATPTKATLSGRMLKQIW
jgi:hypothetical protein